MNIFSTFQRARARGVPGDKGRSRRSTFRMIFSVFMASVLVSGFCSVAAVADAAEVVQMRLGRHQAFTRVVFELDSPAGYSLEQNVLPGGATELVVTLDASASDQEKSLRQALVKKVRLTGLGDRSVARIELSSSGLRVKEMILASPPRIVLDVLAPPALKTTKTTVPMSAAKSQPSAADRKPSAADRKPSATKIKSAAPTPNKRVVAKPTAKPVAKPIAKTRETAKTPKATPPTAAQVAKPSKRTTTSTPVVKAVPPVASVNHGASPAPTRVVTRKAIAPAARPSATPSAPASAKPSGPTAQKPPVPAPIKAAKTPPPPARKKPAARPSRMPAAPAAIPESTSPSMFTPRNIGGGLALLGLVGGGAFFMLRRRAGREPLGEDDFDQDPLADDNPFASLGDDLAGDVGSSDQTAELPIAEYVDESEANVVDEFGSDDQDIPVAKVSADDGSQENLFDTSDDTRVPGADNAAAAGENMETYGDATVNTGMDSMPPIPGGDADTMRMLRELEQRMANLESRLDEVTEAKERLERQVTAQTEELRVQRAAIARTQRALRNLTRPDDDSATEPALREPTT